jgi:CheY-like chemotaxis protein
VATAPASVAEKRSARPLALWERAAATVVGLAVLVFAIVAIFDHRDNDTGSVGLLAIATLFLIIAITNSTIVSAKIAGNEFVFADATRQAIEATQKAGVALAISPASKKAAGARVGRNVELLKGARVLWVDDRPANNAAIVKLFRDAGAIVQTPVANAEALALLRSDHYDVVISDVGRDVGPDKDDPDAKLMGLDFADEVMELRGQKVILYAARFNPLTYPELSDTERVALAKRVERSTFGRTNRPDELIHLVFDTLERRET